MLYRLLANAAALGVATLLLPGIHLDGSDTLAKVLTLLGVALIFGIVNALLKPIFTLVTLPAVLLTLGLFLIVINAVLLWITSSLSGWLGLGWAVDGAGTTVLGAIVVSIVSFLVNTFLPKQDRQR